MEEQPHAAAAAGPRDGGPASHTPHTPGSPTTPAAATATAAEDHAHGAMQHHQQQADGTAPVPSPPPPAADDTSPTTTTAAPPPTAFAGTAPDYSRGSERKASLQPSDIATSPRGTNAGFVAPSSYLRPLAATREREDQQDRSESRHHGMAGEPGARKVMHPLDREQREGLVSGSDRVLIWRFGEAHEADEGCVAGD